MGLVYSGITIIAVLVFAYFLCSRLGDGPSSGDPMPLGGHTFDRLEKVVWFASILGITMIVGSIAWSVVAAHFTSY